MAVHRVGLEGLERVVVNDSLSDEGVGQHRVPVPVKEERNRVLKLLEVALEEVLVYDQLNKVGNEDDTDANCDDEVSPILGTQGPEEALPSFLKLRACHVLERSLVFVFLVAAALSLLSSLLLILALGLDIAVAVVAAGLIVLAALTLAALPLLLHNFCLLLLFTLCL